jgi:O-acetyl-ADP-ribose deacetylase (regulator of RNase III)
MAGRPAGIAERPAEITATAKTSESVLESGTLYGVRLEFVAQDILMSRWEVMVNAAHPLLLHGAGVCGAIHNAAGPQLLTECETNFPGGCPTGDAVIPAAYNLEKRGIRHIIHAVGPNVNGGFASEITVTDDEIAQDEHAQDRAD